MKLRLGQEAGASAGRSRVVTGAGIAAMLFVTPAPASAAEWTPSAPQSIADVDSAVSVSLGASGTGFASWGVYRGGALREQIVVPVDATGALGDRTSIAPSFSTPTVIDAKGRGLVVAKRSGRVVWATLGVNGQLGAVRRIAGSAPTGNPAVGGNARGDAVVAWCQPRGGKAGAATVQYVTRSKAGPFGAIKTVNDPSGCSGWSTVEIGPAGQLAFAFIDERGTHGQRLYASLGKVGKALRSPVLVGKAPHSSEVSAAIDGRGRTYFAWRSQNVGVEVNGPWETRVGSVVAGGTRAQGVRLLGRSKTKDANGGFPELAASPVAGAIVGLTRRSASDANEGVLSIASSAGSFAPLTGLGDRTGLGEIAYRQDGVAVVTWVRQQELVASIVRAGALAAAEPTGLAPGAYDLFINERSGAPLIVAYPELDGTTAQLLRSVRVRP